MLPKPPRARTTVGLVFEPVTENREPQEQADREPEDAKTCFVISPIGEPGTERRRKSDQTFRHLIKPVVEARGYRAMRAHEDDRPGIVTSQVIQRVADADLVVADLTDHNPNVFYELAIRHARQLPLVQVIARDQQLPFDVASMRTVFFDIHDLDDVDRAKGEVARHVDSVMENFQPVETPISVAQQMKQLWESETPADRLLAELVSDVAALRSDFDADKRARDRQVPMTWTTSALKGPLREVDFQSISNVDAVIGGDPAPFTYVRDLDELERSGSSKKKDQGDE